MPSITELNRAVEHYARTILKRNVLVWRFGVSPDVKAKLKKLKFDVNENDYKCRFQDYPASVVSCSNSLTSTIIKSDYSRDCNKNTFMGSIQALLETIGPIGNKASNGCNNIIGHCAEAHAANRVAKTKKGSIPLSFVFSKAIRPRTGEIVPYCENCRRAFKLK